MTRIALVDVDGTLVDTNYQHALAWYRAFRRIDLTLPIWRIHRHIGMGGDQMVGAMAGAAVESQHGDELRAAWSEEFDHYLPEIAAIEGSRELLAALKQDGTRVVLASSGKGEHVETFLDLVEARDVVEAWTTSDDVEATKPEPDIFKAALAKLAEGDDPPSQDAEVFVVGDSTWDCVAAERLGATSYALRLGGFSREELLEAGAAEVFDSLDDLRKALVPAR